MEDINCSELNKIRVFLMIREIPKLKKGDSEFLVTGGLQT